MTVGPKVVKFSYLATTVEVTGTITGWHDEAGTTGDAFELRLDPGYVHIPGNTSGGEAIHCETYPQNIAYRTVEGVLINRLEAWPLPQKPAWDAFQVKIPSMGTSRALKIGDHVRIRGRLLIENGHPQNTSMRGLLQVGFVFPELHPIDFTNIRLVEDPPVGSASTGYVILAAPLWEMVYSGSWLANKTANVDNHIFFEDGGRKYHNTVRASLSVLAPPAGPGIDTSLKVRFRERVTHNGTGRPAGEVRSVTFIPGGIQVEATVSAPLELEFDGVRVADPENPARNRSVFIARYDVWWPGPHDGRLWQTARRPDGTWSGLGDVNAQFNIPGPVWAVAAASSAPDEMQCLFTTEDGHLWHTVRRPDGTWSGLGDVNAQFTIPAGVTDAVIVAADHQMVQSMLVTGPASGSSVLPNATTCNELRNEITRSGLKVTELRKSISRLNPRDPDDREKIHEIQAEIASLNEQVADLQKQFSELGCR